jgi:hypothetical protein
MQYVRDHVETGGCFEDMMNLRLGVKGACVSLLLLVGCGSVRQVSNNPDGGGGNVGSAGAGAGVGGQGGGTAGTNGGGSGGSVSGGGTGGAGGGGGSSAGASAGTGGGASGNGGGGASGNGGGGASGNGGRGGASGGGGGGVSGSGGGGVSGKGGVSGSGGAAGTGRPCNPQAPFGSPAALAALNSLQDENGVDFSSNGLTAYVSSRRPGGPGPLDIFSASRASTADAFGTLTPVPGVNTTGNEYQPRISADGLKLFFTAPKANGRYGIVVATRNSTLTSFGAGAPLLNVSSTDADEGGAFLTADGKSIYFSSNRPGLGGEDIYVAGIGADGSFGTPSLVTELSSAVQDANPVLTADGLVAYISSQRSGVNQAEIYVATRPTVNDKFSTPLPVTELNSPAQDWPAAISADGCTLYFCSERTAGTNGQTGADIFSATRGQ